MKIVLPWPNPKLTPNAKRRKHWRSYQPAIKADRETAWGIACSSIALRDKRAIRASEGKISLTITFYPPDNRRRDDDGMISAFKHMRDGIADALGVDDHRFKPSYVFADPEKPGRVEVALCPPSSQNVSFFSQQAPVNAAIDGVENNEAEQCCNTARPTPETLTRSATDAA